MSYTKTVWKNGESPPISAENLNKIENALESHDEDISDLKNAIEQIEGGGSALSSNLKTILLLITAVLRSAMYNSDMSSVITQIVDLINSSDEGGDDPTPPTPQEVVVTQVGTVLQLSNVPNITSVSQNGVILTLS